MLGKHIYQSVSRVVCLVGVSGLSRSLHSCQECALCCTIWVRKMCCTICVQAGNQYAFKSHFRLKSSKNAQTYRQLWTLSDLWEIEKFLVQFTLLCVPSHSHCKASVELQSDKIVKWIFSVFAGGLSTWQDNVHECKSNTACSFLACLFPSSQNKSQYWIFFFLCLWSCWNIFNITTCHLLVLQLKVERIYFRHFFCNAFEINFYTWHEHKYYSYVIKL